MRLARVKLRNFRCHREDTEIEIGSLTALIGRNDAGKSSFLEALQIFFDNKIPDGDDASNGGEKGDCRIICEFEDLPDVLILDAQHKTTLKAEHLLNEAGRLEIHKVYDCSLARPKLEGVYARAVHPSASGMNDLLSLKNAELKKRATELKVDTTKTDLKVNSEIRQAIWKSAKVLAPISQEVPLTGEGARPIWDQLAKQMPLFQLFKSDRPSTDQDAEAQDPMRLAVKEALKSKESELEKITQFVEEQVRAIAAETVQKIKDMDPALASQLHPQFTSPKWDSVFKISLTGDEDIPVNKRGSGVRRLILLNFFRAKAERALADQQASGIIYAIEEPETCQHPNSQRMLMRAFQELAERSGCQVIITTHNPTLARLLPTESLRFIECPAVGGRKIHSGDAAATLVAKALGVLPDHDVRLFIGVEGIHDINFLQIVSEMLHRAGEDVPNLRALEDEGKIVFIPLGGSNLVLWATRLNKLNRPEFHIYDREEKPPKQPKYLKHVERLKQRPNCKAYSTTKLTMENYLHPDALTKARATIKLKFSEFDDLPSMVAQFYHDESNPGKKWEDASNDTKRKNAQTAKHWLNRDAASQMTPQLLSEADPKDELRGWLKEIGEMIAESV